MLREKLFLSIVFLILSLLTGLACLPLFGALFVDQRSAATLAMAVLLLLPLLSLGLLWRAQVASIYGLRRFSFLCWACILCLVGIGNLIVTRNQANVDSTIFIMGIVCVAISLHARHKENRQKQAKASAAS